MGDNIPDKRI